MPIRAVAFDEPLPIGHESSLIDVTVERSALRSRDLLVEVRAVSVNPVDTKIRGGVGPILGWDAAGVVPRWARRSLISKSVTRCITLGPLTAAGLMRSIGRLMLGLWVASHGVLALPRRRRCRWRRSRPGS